MELVLTVLFLVSVCRVAAQHQAEHCGGDFTQPSGSISSPYPRSYPNHQDCIYVIQAVAGHRVTLNFVVFKLEPGSTSGVCDHDYVQIRDGHSLASPSIGLYCNTTFPPKVRSTRNVMWIEFHSDSIVSKTGFKATYTTGIIPQKFLLMTNTYLRAIHRMDLDTGSNFIIPIDGLSNPIAIDFDPVDGRLYWTDVIEKTIRSSNLDGSDVRLVRNLGPHPNGCGNNNGGCDYICVPALGNTSQCLYPDGIATGYIITSVVTDSKTATLNDTRITSPAISVTPDGQKVTAGSKRFAAAVNKVLAAMSKVPSDINTVTPSISRVNTVVTNLSRDISRVYVSEAPSISPQLIILVIGCIVVSVTAASCVTFIIVYNRRKRDQNRHTTAVTPPPGANPSSRTEAPPTDIVSTDYLTPVAADSNYEDVEHIYHELHTIYDTFKATSRDSGDYLKLTK